jgi:pyridoxal 5'-phosphate synthase pdxS subunit
MDPAELMAEAKLLGAPYHLVQQVAKTGELPVPNFAAGGVSTPADAALMMQLGAQTVFVGSGIFKAEDPAERARAIVGAVTYFQDPAMLAEISRGLLNPMKGIDVRQLSKEDLMARRGW